MAAASTGDVWAAGSYSDSSGNFRALVEHWDGLAWTIVNIPSPYANSQFGVVASGVANDVWALGTHGEGTAGGDLVAHWDGASWTVIGVPSPYERNDFNAAAAISEESIWMVGSYADGETVKTLAARLVPCQPIPTPTRTSCSVCNLEVTRVTLTCNPNNSLAWTATVRNRGTGMVVNPWTAKLQVKVPGPTKFVDVQTSNGTGTFPPGYTTVSGTFTYDFPPEVVAARSEFRLDSEGRPAPKARSEGIEPCR